MIQKAIAHYKHGINHDIFSESVISYAKLAVNALEKQVPKKVIYVDEHFFYVAYCPACGSYVGTGSATHVKFCRNCGQALDWSERQK